MAGKKEAIARGSLLFETRQFEIELLTDMLGTVPKNQDVYAAYIAQKVAEKAKNRGEDELQAIESVIKEEVQTVEDIEAKGWTGFHREADGSLFIYEYMIKGFLKTAIEVLVDNGAINKIPAYKKWIDRMIFVEPRKLYFGIKEPDGILERPLRTMTPKGERVTVTRSDYVRAGRRLLFNIKQLTSARISWETVGLALTYGQYVGLGQWRGSGGYGRFRIVSTSAL